ncbi:MAG: BREX system P-loop protein BrxC [Bacteroidales bacterium]|nr:BREX system P-loop protein BrxC [Bacteroidales bacterium]
MIQQHIYSKDIERPINGVIKAGSETELANEVTEYVITAEQQKPQLLPAFFKMLIPPQNPTCVWISGDFGSGKSHLLKILSYVLENELEIDGRRCAELFAEKAGDDFELKGDILKACKVPTESVLFNIQEKLDGIGKSQIDPVLNIFLKEFNRKLGFDDKKPEIAEIERYFAKKGKYEWLKTEYKNRFNKEWIEDRPSILLKKQNLAKLFAEMEGISEAEAQSNITTHISRYTLDTDGFVKLIMEHLDEQAPGSRMVFFVDEVGQFIGKDVHRMLSLQTIAEGLIDKTGGRASIIVTSQMDIDATLGNLEKQQEYDFSRIQARFTTRISLTSANADEVIQRRLLEKKPEPQKALCAVYDRQKNIIKSLFNFGDNSQFKSAYKSDEQFATDFPFIDYQFDLLQRSIVELSKNNAFSGKQQSVGERSLLTITQEVAKAYKDKDLEQIVQFCDMYEGIRGILQTKVQSDIQQAERTLNDEMALKVLKVLFLVKYVKGFPSTVDNITKIMLPTLDTDFPEYKSQIQEALNRLVHTSYIEKGANDEYHYQTNEEKDIETEIKNEDLQPDAINNELKKIFRDDIFSDNKIKLSTFKTFSYGRIVDEQQDGRDAEMYIHFITPLNNFPTTDQQAMLMYSMGHSDQLLVVLDEDKYMAEDIAMFKKADKCLTRLLPANQDGYRQQIVTDKRRVNTRRREDIVTRLTNLTKGAHLYMGGQEITDIRQTDIKPRLNEAMAKLVEQVYTNLKMLTIEYDDTMLKQIIADTNATGPFGYTMGNCEQEVFNWINRNKQLSVRSKVKDLVEHFRGNTYGWYETATLCILAKLYKMDKISFRSNGSPVADRDLYFNMTNSNAQTALLVDIEETISASQIAKLKGLYKEFFNDESCAAQSAKEVHQQFITRLDQVISELRSIKDQNNFEFAKPLEQILPEFQQLAGCVYPALYNKTSQIEAAIDRKIDEADVINDFVQGNQFNIFRRIATTKNGNQANFNYVSKELIDTIDDVYVSKTPWIQMTKAKDTLDAIGDEIQTRQQTERQAALQNIEAKLTALTTLSTFATLEASQQGQVTAMFAALKAKAENERFIGNLIAMGEEIGNAYDTCLTSINKWVKEDAERKAQQQKGTGVQQPPARPVKTYVNRTNAMNVQFSKNVLETKEDVEEYVNALLERLLEFIEQNKSIMLS